MINSKGSVVVGEQGAYGAGVDLFVVPDGCGEGEQALEHAGCDTGRGAPAVALEVKLALQGVVDRFDDLAERLEEPGAWPGSFTGHRWADERRVVVGEERLRLAAAIAVVGQDGLPAAVIEQGGLHLEQVAQYLAFVGLGVGEGNAARRQGCWGGRRSPKADREPSRCADQVESQAPEVAAVAGAVAVAGEPGQVAALGGLAAASAFTYT